jgi:SOS response regulatory protein OraA/RecX
MPVILKLIPRRRKTWAELVPDWGDSIKLPRELLPSDIAAGTKVDESRWGELTALAEYHGLRDRALRILGRREHFIAELKSKLFMHCRDAEVIMRVLADCRRLGYLDNERAASLLTAQLIARGGIGKSRLKQELIKRGCPVELARAQVAGHSAELDEAAVVKELLKSRRRQFASRARRMKAKLEPQHGAGTRLNRELRQKLGAAVLSFLAARGLTGDVARQPAREMVEELLSETTGARELTSEP